MNKFRRVFNIFYLGSVLSIALIPNAYGLGFGKLEVISGLGEPFEGRIALTSLYAGDTAALEVALASLQDFDQAGVQRPEILERLQFKIAGDGVNPFIRVSSQGPIHEPFLQFMVALKWQGGKLVRSYTALLDPPRYARGNTTPKTVAPKSETQLAEAISRPAASGQQTIQAIASVAEHPATVQSADQHAVHGGSVTVQPGQSLWVVADRIRDDGVSIHQMMIALFEGNPAAFINGDINRIKAGTVLTVPEEPTVTGVDSVWAAVEFSRLAAGATLQGDVTPLADDSPVETTQSGIPIDAMDANDEYIELTDPAAREFTQEPAAVDPQARIDEILTSESTTPETTSQERDAPQNEVSTITALEGDTEASSEVQISAADIGAEELQSLAQKISRLENTLLQSNTENTLLKERIASLEQKIESTNQFIEFERIAQAVTENNALSDAMDLEEQKPTGDVALTSPSFTSSSTGDSSVYALTGTIAEDSASAADTTSQSVIVQGIREATDQLNDGFTAENAPASETQDGTTTVAADQAEVQEPEEIVPSRWIKFQDAVSNRFDNLSKKLASTHSDSMQPILATIAVIIFALGAIMAIFRHRRIAYAPANEVARTSRPDDNRLRPNEDQKPSISRLHYEQADAGHSDNLPDTEEKTVILENIQTKTSDPVEEAEVYMALGREDSAEQTLKDAIKGGSVDTEASMKLMEIYQKRQPKVITEMPVHKPKPSEQSPDEKPYPDEPDAISSNAEVEVTETPAERPEVSVSIDQEVIDEIRAAQSNKNGEGTSISKMEKRGETVAEKKLTLDELSTPPPSNNVGQGIPVFEIEDDGLSPTERNAVQNAARTTEESTLISDKDAKIQDLETKLDRLQNQMDELLRRLSQDDDSNHSSGAA